MNPKSIERASEFACNFVMTTMCIALVAAYFFLFSVFRSDHGAIHPVAVEQQVDDELSDLEPGLLSRVRPRIA